MGLFRKYETLRIPIFDTLPLPQSVIAYLDPLPPCHHPNSGKLFDPKLTEKSLIQRIVAVGGRESTADNFGRDGTVTAFCRIT